MNSRKELVERFLRYVQVPSQSCAAQKSVPSSEGQRTLGRLLEQELKGMGVTEVFCDEKPALLYAFLKGNTKASSVGFVSHLDTIDISLSPQVRPQILHYEGGDVLLNAAQNLKIKLAEHPELEKYRGQDIVFSDGTSVLGADNKAAMAVIMTMLSVLCADPSIPHGDIYVAFVPDEEIGLRGSRLLDLERFKPDFAYTIDCCALGELVYETFNAGRAEISIRGVSAHPMSAKGVMINPILVARDFIDMFDSEQTPECTCAKEGFWWFETLHSDVTNCQIILQIRDHDKARYEWRKQVVMDHIERLKKLHSRAVIKCELFDTYENIANNVKREDKPVALLYQAFATLGIKANTYAMRGGTDGSMLSARGLVTPNYFTGAENFHNAAEFLPLDSFEKSFLVTMKLLELAAKPA